MKAETKGKPTIERHCPATNGIYCVNSTHTQKQIVTPRDADMLIIPRSVKSIKKVEVTKYSMAGERG